jgi:hypothetical protein
MENFFDWIMKPISYEYVNDWVNAHNMSYEKISLFFDVVISLHQTVLDTYMGSYDGISSIQLTNEDKKNHFNWCWEKIIKSFKEENIILNQFGEHRDYMETFYWDAFYQINDDNVKDSIPIFFNNIFNMSKTFTKSDLDMLTEIYKLMDKNIIFNLTN